MHNTVGAVLIVRNEEAMIENCIRSLVGLDEIVVLDTGSVDGTIGILAGLTLEIPNLYVFKEIYSWKDDFADARNFAKGLCNSQWILSIDADETLPEGEANRIRSLVHSVPHLVAVSCRMIYGPMEFYTTRLFQNLDWVRWCGRVHETVDAPACGVFQPPTIHVGYSPSHARDPERNLRILLSTPERGPRETYYISSWFWERGHWKEAIRWFLRYLRTQDPFGAQRADAFYQAAVAFANRGKKQMALACCENAIKLVPQFKAALNFMWNLTGDPVWKEKADTATNQGTLFAR